MFPNDTIIEGHWRKVERRNRECGGIKGDGRMMIVNDWIMKFDVFLVAVFLSRKESVIMQFWLLILIESREEEEEVS